jgi:uncharacterized LabA/DUF88 family protein
MAFTELAKLYPYIMQGARAMVFVDGENLAIRYGKARREDAAEREKQLNIWYRPKLAVWADHLTPDNMALPHTTVVRKYYFTSVQGDEPSRTEAVDWLKEHRFETPRVFRKDKERGSKQVDITLSVEMLMHGTRHHYEIAILVAGDADYVPLVRAVKNEGARVHVWFLSDGLSPELRRESDYFVNLDQDFDVSQANAAGK